MKEIIVGKDEANQRLDRLLGKYLNLATTGFIYKMLRKKNITLNGKKATGKEVLSNGDSIKIFLSDETYAKFSKSESKKIKSYAYLPDVVYEDEEILIVNKPSGMLSQKANAEDISLNEYCLSYCMKQGILTEESLRNFTPSICNRLDRNTSGLVLFAKKIEAARLLTKALKERTIEKYYQCIVAGHVTKAEHIKGYLVKDSFKNQVTVTKEQPEGSAGADYAEIETFYRPLSYHKDMTLLEVELITGKPHQIRAHLASIQHPIIGDPKYGDALINEKYKKLCHITSQLLHAYRLVMPEFQDTLSRLSKKTIEIETTKEIRRVMNS